MINNLKPNSTEKRLFFIALLPPLQVQKIAQAMKEEFANLYHSKNGLKSPPHITLQAPFKWPINQINLLRENLEKFCQNQTSIPIILDNFGSFKPRVIYINVEKTTELLKIQQELSLNLASNLNIIDHRSKNRAFNPHLTLAHKDLTPRNYDQAWEKYQDKTIHFEFIVSELTLLLHQDRKWEIYQQFQLKNIA